MKSKCKLGDIISQRREKYNGENLPICGVTRDGFIPPKQKDADLSLYNVFYKDDFVFNPARMELNAIVFNDIYEKAICSSLYEIFYVSKPDIVLPSFLALLVKQAWFTRYCEFLGSGSAREYCRVVNISEIEIEYPDLDEQRRIVNEYDVIRNRIALKRRINDNLEATAMTLFKSWFVDFEPFDCDKRGVPFNWQLTTLESRVSTSTQSINPQKIATSKVWHYSIPAFDSERLPCLDTAKDILSNKYLVPADAILVSKLNPETKRIWRTLRCFNDAICSTEFIVFNSLNKKHRAFYYLLFNTNQFIDFLVSNATGSTNSRMRVKPASSLDFEFIVPPDNVLDRFCSEVEPLLSEIDNNLLETRKLSSLIPVAVAKMMSSSR
jgi:restriction endonuclease S subunit